MFSEYKIRRPAKNFNLIYLQNNQVHLMELSVRLVMDETLEEIDGRLHLCSRSIFFQPSNIAKPLIRIKYSCGVVLRMMKNIQNKKVTKIFSMKKTENQFKAMFEKGPNYLTELLQKNQKNDPPKVSKLKSTILLNKLYEPLIKKKVESQDKILNCLFIKVQKIFIVYRQPVSPYITQKTEENFIFSINKINAMAKILRFLKIYDELTKSTNQQVIINLSKRLIKSIINATYQECAQEVLNLHRDEKLQHTNILKCKRINLQGPQYGQFILLKNKIKFIPLINCPNQQIIQFSYRELKYALRYRYLFEDTGIQIWAYNFPYSILLVFEDKNARQNVYRQLKSSGEKLINIQIVDVVNMWVNGEISNVQYLTYVNLLGNRSFNHLSQYPVFPWIIHSYDLAFDLRNAEIYRNLGKPIGAINKHRLRKLKDIYEMQTRDKTLTNPPHLYATHYSTPGYVCYYLIRKIPELIVKLQNGVFSPSDRIFRCIQSTYYASMNSVADFKEIIPQFYSNECDFLVNSGKLEMGSTPEGEIIDDVILPKWAVNAQDFLLKMRAAFEADYVSAHLNQWIDLVFGYKQSATSAITSDNLFYYLTYKDNVDFNKPMSRVQRAALDVQISEFGQVPVQIFEERHPTKKTRILSLDIAQSVDDKKVMNAKMMALGEENQRLEDQLQRERYRFNKKLNEREEMLIKIQKEKKKEIEKIRQKLSIDTKNLQKFEFTDNFKNEDERNKYIRQLEELLKIKDRQNEQLNIIVTGMARQINDEEQSVKSEIQQDAEIEADFFDQPKKL